MRHHAFDKGPLPTHTCPPENLGAFPGNRRTKVLLILKLVSSSEVQNATLKVERIRNHDQKESSIDICLKTFVGQASCRLLTTHFAVRMFNG